MIPCCHTNLSFFLLLYSFQFQKGGGTIDLEPCLTHTSAVEPTLAPVAVERTMTTRAAASVCLVILVYHSGSVFVFFLFIVSLPCHVQMIMLIQFDKKNGFVRKDNLGLEFLHFHSQDKD